MKKVPVTFNSIDGVDTNSSDPNGLDEVVAAGSFTISLPTTGTGSSISSTVYTKDIKTPTPENVAKAILKDIRNKGTVASLSGISAIGGQLGVSKFSMSGSFTNDQTAVFSIEAQYFHLQCWR